MFRPNSIEETKQDSPVSVFFFPTLFIVSSILGSSCAGRNCQATNFRKRFFVPLLFTESQSVLGPSRAGRNCQEKISYSFYSHAY